MARTKGTPPPPPAGETIVQCAMEEVMHQSMLPYSEYVILERALPRMEQEGYRFRLLVETDF